MALCHVALVNDGHLVKRTHLSHCEMCWKTSAEDEISKVSENKQTENMMK